jgi:hypothetical protein
MERMDMQSRNQYLTVLRGSYLRARTKKANETIYMLLAPPDLPVTHIKVYVLKDYLKEKLGISFKERIS